MAKKVTPTNLSYLGFLQQSPTEQLQEELQYRVQEVKSSWEVNISKTRASLARAEQNLNNAYRNADLQAIISYTDQIESYTRGLDVALKAFAQLFPIEVA